MQSLVDSVKLSLTPYLNRPIWLAYSGGVDSQVLLHLCIQLKKQCPSLNLTLCHIHHGLSKNADDWLIFGELQARKHHVPFVSQKLEIKKQSRESLEAVARTARYQAITNLAPDDAVILTGHHLDDQLETVLIALKRGTGLGGLSGIAAQSTIGDKQQLLLRPLLQSSQAQIIRYAQDHQLAWVEDESNQDRQFDRNFLRHEVIPLLTKRWPQIAQTTSRSAEHCGQAQTLLDEYLALDFEKVVEHSDNTLDIARLIQFDDARFNQLIRFWLKRSGCLMPSISQLKELKKQLAENDNNAQLKVGDHWLRRFQQQLYLTPQLQDISQWKNKVVVSTLLKEKSLRLMLPDKLGQLLIEVLDPNAELEHTAIEAQILYLARTVNTIEVSFTTAQKKCQPAFRQHSRELKKIWQELAVPTWQRKRIPLIEVDGELAMAVGKFVCLPFSQPHSTIILKVSWLGY